MKQPNLSRPLRPRATAVVALLLTGAVLFGGAFPARRAAAAPARQISPAQAFEQKADLRLRRTYQTVMSARGGKTARAESAGERALLAAQLDEMTRTEGLAVTSAGTVTVRLTVELGVASDEELARAGFRVGARIGDVATVEAEVGALPRLAALASVERLAAISTSYPTALPNDLARQSVGVDNSGGVRALTQTGKGVVVGIIDSGIDFRHKDFTIPGTDGKKTRIKALLDLTTYVDADKDGKDDNWDYSLPGQTAKIGKLYTEDQINASLAAGNLTQEQDTVKERDWNGHGTHVAGTAVGNGLGAPTQGKYAGMAPEADILVIKATRNNNKDGGFANDDQLNSLAFIEQKAKELNEPFVVNMSLGGHNGPHDGTDAVEKAIDNLVAAGPGRVVCVAAGNEGEQKLHTSGTLATGATKTLTVKLPDDKGGFVDLYYPGDDRFTVKVTQPDGAETKVVKFGESDAKDFVTVDNGTERTGLNKINIRMSEKVFATRNWTITLTGESVTAGGRYDGWTGDDGDFGADADPSMRVGTPGTSQGAITVGAYISRLRPNEDAQVGNFGPFSSPGPTRDNRQKPDISAPGALIQSSKSADQVLKEGESLAPDSQVHWGSQGTSMATPATAGVIALLFQANPSLTNEQVRSLLKETAKKDGFTGADAWHPRFGFGKLDAAAAVVKATATPTPTPTPTATPTPTPTATPTPTPTATPTPTPSPSVQFGQATYTVGEGAGSVAVAVTRVGDASAAATLDYATANGTASDRSDYTAARGTLRFAAGEASKTISVLLTDDLTVEGSETFTVGLNNPSGTSLGAQATATVTITDNDSNQPTTNPADDASFFVRQHYLDYLHREPDASGLAFWTGQMTSCGGASLEVCRINVSAAFFLSIEFQQTGYLVERAYKVAYGDATGSSTLGGQHQLAVPVVRLNEFLADTQEIRQNVVVNVGDWQQQLEANKQAYFLLFVRRQRFKDAFPSTMTAAEFVAKLDQNAGGVLSAAEKDAQAAALGSTPADDSKRAQVLRAVAENAELDRREKNRAFVLMQYFGYLRRDPDAAPDSNFTGYDFWLAKLNQFTGDFVKAEMVKAFLSSDEYRKRFGQ